MKDHQAIWAKKSDKEGVYKWLPLDIHLEDTMNVSGWLWNNWLSEGQRKYIVSQMSFSEREADEEDAEKLVRFLGAVHDIGKAAPAFQLQKGFASSPDLDSILTENLERSGFSGISGTVLESGHRTHHTLIGEVLLREYGLREDISSVIGAHHGKPVSSIYDLENSEDAYTANYFQSEDVSSEIALRWKNVQRYFFIKAAENAGIAPEYPDKFPEISQPAQFILSGLLIMADWISSNESYFPLFFLDEEYPEYDRRCRFEKGMKKWFNNLPITFYEPETAEELFHTRFRYKPREFQKIIFNRLKGAKDPGIVIIEAPTGSGKTEAALACAELLAAKSGKSGIFFGLPTQATSNGIFPRICDWTESISKEYGDTSLRLVHGKAALNRNMQELRHQKTDMAVHVDIESGMDNGTVSVNEWFSGRKKAVLDDFVVGTVDQFLLAALKQKHLALRHLGFSKKVVIIDEVHAYDAYMQQYLKEALRWAGAYHIPVILLSATLPEKIRYNLIYEYMKGKGLRRKELKEQLNALSADVYPHLVFSDGNKIYEHNDFPKGKDREVQVVRLREEELYNKLKEFSEEGGITGIIVNTVRRSQDIAKECMKLFGKDRVELLHSNFIAADRIKKEEALIKMIGRDGSRPRGKIIIGTQVLEQSLDIDFDVLVTDLCPMDLLIQRAGRLQRHKINRPEKFTSPVLYIMGESDTWDFEKGSSAVYGDFLLARTQIFLSQVIRIPSDVSELVQKVYNKESDDEVIKKELQDKYREFKERFENVRLKKEKKAEGYRLSDPKLKINPSKNNLIGILNMSNEAGEERSYAQVRDSAETIEVIAVKKAGSGYGTFHGRKDISSEIGDPKTERLIAAQTIKLPFALTAGHAEDIIKELEEYNRKNIPEWQNTPWLKGTLGLIFDEHNEFVFNGHKLYYDDLYGLKLMEGGEKNESV